MDKEPTLPYSLKYVFPSLPRTQRGMPIVIGGDPKGKNYLYTNNNSVFIRSLTDITQCDIYTEHSCPVNCAKYSPSGFYIASGDNSGKIRIWDTVNKEHILKNEYQPLGKGIKDIAWSADNQRIVVGGDGREKYSHVFLADSGTSNGEVTGHTKQVNSVDFKSSRPFRIAVASEDQTASFHSGPPFKFTKTLTDHTNFVQAVRYSPDGSMFVTAGSDGRLFMYDGATADLKGELGSPAHKGGVYAISFHREGKMLMSVSGDKTVKVWDVTSGQVCREYQVGADLTDMQVGCLWSEDTLISVSLSGYINYWSLEQATSPVKIIKGHNKPITCMSLSEDKTRLYTGCMDSVIMNWDVTTGLCEPVQGKGHKNQVQSMAVCDDTLITCGMDDTVFFSNNDEYGANVKVKSMPKKLAATPGGLVVVACVNDIAVIRDKKLICTVPAPYGPLCVAIHPGNHEIAVGGDTDQSVHIYSVSNDTLSETKCMKHSGQIYDLRYSPDGARLAAVDGARRLTVYLTAEEYKKEDDVVKHNARVMCVAWSPDSQYISSGGLDAHVFVYKVGQLRKVIQILNAHTQNQVNALDWVDHNTVVSVAQDSNIKFWTIKQLPN